MKKLLIFALALTFSGFAYSQIHFGPQIGYVASNLTLDKGDIENNLKSNFLLGGFVRLGKKIYIQPEANYMTQGSVFKWPQIGNLSPLEQEITVKTLQVPVNLGWRMINLEILNIRLFGGVVANFNLNTTIENTGDADEYDDKLIPDDFKGTTWQWDAGVGVDVLMFAIDVKYVGGLTNVLNDVTIENNTITSKSNLFVVTLGWKIF